MAIITLRNGISLEIPDVDDPEAGRALRPFVPHPCQKEEFEDQTPYTHTFTVDVEKANQHSEKELKKFFKKLSKLPVYLRFPDKR